MVKYVWQFTNKRKLTGKEFVRYFESKVKKTIRKYGMPMNKLKGPSLKVRVINNITKELPVKKGKLSFENLDDISIKVLYVMMYGKEKDLEKLKVRNQPLYFLSDAEISLYAKLNKIKGKIHEREGKEKEINDFIKKIEGKNPDIRQNIIRGLKQ